MYLITVDVNSIIVLSYLTKLPVTYMYLITVDVNSIIVLSYLTKLSFIIIINYDCK